MAAAAQHATGIACDDHALRTARAAVKDASFTSAKIAMYRTLCQNFVFTTAQVAELLSEVSMSSDKLAALDVFAGSISDPGNAHPIVSLFSMSGDKRAAEGKVTGFKAAVAGTLATYRIEDDGHRSAADMARFISAIQGARMSGDKVEVARRECLEHPSPPFDCDQLLAVLKCFSFSADVARVLDFFAGPAIVYPMSCDEIVRVLGAFSMSNDKLAVLPSLKRFIKDPQNKLSIVASFSFSSDKEKAEEILRDVVVKLVPPEPPAAKVQEALQRVGRCPAGYNWRKVEGGWRCAAGGHYVSDAQLAAAISLAMADEFQAADGATRALLALAECRRSGLLTDREVTACKLGVARDDALLRAAVNCYAISRDLGEFSHSCRSMLLLHAAEPMATPVADAGGPDRVLLYRADAFAAIAAQAAAMSRGGVELGDIAWGSFADGFPNLVIANARDLRHRRVAFIASLHSTEVLFQQIAIAYALPRYMASHVHIIIPYFPTATMERVDRAGQVATARTLARMLSATPQHATGPTLFTILDIHAVQEAFYFSDNVLVQLKSCASLLRRRLQALPDADTVSICFPDDGAYKRFKIKFADFPLVVCVKVRDGDERRVTIKEGDVRGRHIIIVDDLVQTGGACASMVDAIAARLIVRRRPGTLLECFNALLAHGAARVSAFVTHGVFPKDAWKRFVGSPFAHVWITDTLPETASKVSGVAPFEVLSVAPLLAEVIMNGPGGGLVGGGARATTSGGRAGHFIASLDDDDLDDRDRGVTAAGTSPAVRLPPSAATLHVTRDDSCSGSS